MLKELVTWESSSQIILDHEGMITFKEIPQQINPQAK